jgi:hypothetical protein
MDSWETLIEIRMSGDGFNGTVGFGWDVGYQSLMIYRLNDGAPFGVMQEGYGLVAALMTCPVGHGSARLCCSGRITRLFR